MSKVHGWRRPVRWARNILLGIFAVLTVAVLGAYLVFETGYGREQLRAQIETRVANGFIGGASIRGLEGNPFGELVLLDVVIRDADRRPAIQIDRLAVKLSLMPLLSNQLRVDHIIADGVDVLIRTDSHGRTNLANLAKPSEPSTWSIELLDVEVHRGHIRSELGAEPLDIDDLEIVANATLPFSGPIDASLSVSADWRQKRAPIDVAASIHLDDRETRVNSAAIQIADIDVAITQLAVASGPFMKPATGVVSVYAPRATLSMLAPRVDVPGDVGLLVTATPDGRRTQIVVKAAVGDARVAADVAADLQAKLADGVIDLRDLDLAALTGGKLHGGGEARIAFGIDANDPVAELPTASVHIDVTGKAGHAPATTATVDLSTLGDRATATVVATSDTGLRANVDVVLRKRGERVILERGAIVAATADARRASQGVVPLRGTLRANVQASGVLAPQMDLVVSGDIRGRRMRFDDIAARAFVLTIEAKHLPQAPVGTARLEVADLRRGELELGKLTVAARNRPDGKLQVTVRSQPKQPPWRADLDALVTVGNTVNVELRRHVVRAAGGSVWRGHGGTLRVSPREIELRNFASRSGGGRIAAAATFVRAGRGAGNLDATVAATLDLAKLHHGYTGKLDAQVDLSRRGRRFGGVLDVKARGVAFGDAMRGTLDATVQASAKADELRANVSVGSAATGWATVVLDLDAPKNIAEPAAWRTLGRDAIRNARLILDRIDLAEVANLVRAAPMAGTIDGEIELTSDGAGGAIEARGVQLERTRGLGTIEADLEMSDAGDGELRTRLTARLRTTEAATPAKHVTQGGAARLLADVRFELPDRVFDPRAWRALGASAFRGGTLGADGIAFEPGTLERLGIVSDMRGELAFGAAIGPAFSAACVSVDLHRLQGGVFARPIAANLSAVVDNTSSRMTASIVADNVTLVRLDGHIPVSLAELRASPRVVWTAPLAVTATIERAPVRTLLAVLGISQGANGTIDGTIEVTGTVADPTVGVKLVARDVRVPPDGSKQTQAIVRLTLNGSWDGTTATVAIDGTQSAGGLLSVRAAVNPDELAAATASLYARNLDLAPLVAFLPGPAGAFGGRLDAKFQLEGADPRTADLAGDLHVTNGRIPIAPAVGTVFEADLKVGVHQRNIDLVLAGKLGRGDIKLTAKAPLDGTTLQPGKLSLTLRRVQLIGTTEPIISGTVTADVARVDDVWRAMVRVNGMDIDIPEQKGAKLDPVGAPADIVYGGEQHHHGKHETRDVRQRVVYHEGRADFERARAPFADIEIQISNVFVESHEARGLLGGNLRLTIGANRAIGIVGRVAIARGVLELFGRRYVIETANMMFDGSPDPVVDIRITHDFPDVTTIAEVRGRLSKPRLVLSSNPQQYTQAELLGFLLGGEPGGSPEDALSATTRVASAGASLVANRIAAPIKAALPFDIDVLRYESASATTSAGVTVGTWITDTLFLAYRRQLEARPDENAGQAELEYWLRRRLVIEAVAGDRGRHGLDVLWRRRW